LAAGTNVDDEVGGSDDDGVCLRVMQRAWARASPETITV